MQNNTASKKVTFQYGKQLLTRLRSFPPSLIDEPVLGLLKNIQIIFLKTYITYTE